ncbi:MAG: chloride channel protein, partial [Saprospiraceae bacterium]
MKSKVAAVLEHRWQETSNFIKSVFDNIRNEKLKQHLLQALPFWVASLITGLAAVLYAKIFAQAEKLAAFVFHANIWLMLVLSPLCFLAAWWLIVRFAPYARGSGIPQVMAAIELSIPKVQGKVRQLLSLRIIAVKVVSSTILVIGGAAIGREGPTIQIAASIFRKINELLPEWWPKISKRNMIMTGAAAGLAAAFNTPLGGIVFAIEELTKTHFSYYKTAIFTAVIIAGLTAQGLAGPYLYLGYPLVSDLSWFILLGVALVALIAGWLGTYTTRVMLQVLRWKSTFKTNGQHVLYLVATALILILAARFISEGIMGSGKELMTSTLFGTDKYLPWYMPLLRIIGPILSFTSGGAGGVFAPGLSAGA